MLSLKDDISHFFLIILLLLWCIKSSCVSCFIVLTWLCSRLHLIRAHKLFCILIAVSTCVGARMCTCDGETSQNVGQGRIFWSAAVGGKDFNLDLQLTPPRQRRAREEGQLVEQNEKVLDAWSPMVENSFEGHLEGRVNIVWVVEEKNISEREEGPR